MYFIFIHFFGHSNIITNMIIELINLHLCLHSINNKVLKRKKYYYKEVMVLVTEFCFCKCLNCLLAII